MTARATRSDLRRWQRLGLLHLQGVLAATAHLEPLGWRLSHLGDLVGEVDAVLLTSDEAIAVWTAWVNHLELKSGRIAGTRRVAHGSFGRINTQISVVLDTVLCKDQS